MSMIQLKISDPKKLRWTGEITVTINEKTYNDPALKPIVLMGLINRELERGVSLFRVTTDEIPEFEYSLIKNRAEEPIAEKPDDSLATREGEPEDLYHKDGGLRSNEVPSDRRGYRF